ncbi:MAG: electron transport complex subunit RsxA [Alistipes indistinctus]|nr:electron transport complex subunit RsxA [Alistipes indistinctus]MBD9133558.1 electron transport complex subunit RsxA [Alistipes indistinctus]
MGMEYFVIIISSIFVNNIVLSQFLGICPFLGVSGKVSTSLGMGAAVTFVLAIASIAAYLIQYHILVPLHIEYMQTIVFILVIAALVQMVEIMLKKVSPALYQALGIFLPLITTNCAVLGVAILLVQKEYNLGEAVVYAVAVAVGFTLALVLFAGLRERLELENVPKALRGVPIALITAGILAMAFMGFSGLVR